MTEPAICDILVKQLAKNFRRNFPDLRIEGHPSQMDHFPSCYLPRLIVANQSRDYLLQFSFNHCNDDIIVVRVSIKSSIQIPYWAHMRKSQRFELSNPSSIDDLERWITIYTRLYQSRVKSPSSKDSSKHPSGEKHDSQ